MAKQPAYAVCYTCNGLGVVPKGYYSRRRVETYKRAFKRHVFPTERCRTCNGGITWGSFNWESSDG